MGLVLLSRGQWPSSLNTHTTLRDRFTATSAGIGRQRPRAWRRAAISAHSLSSLNAGGVSYCNACSATGLVSWNPNYMALRSNCDRSRWVCPLLVIRCQDYSQKACHCSDRIAAACGVGGGRRRSNEQNSRLVFVALSATASILRCPKRPECYPCSMSCGCP